MNRLACSMRANYFNITGALYTIFLENCIKGTDDGNATPVFSTTGTTVTEMTTTATSVMTLVTTPSLNSTNDLYSVYIPDWATDLLVLGGVLLLIISIFLLIKYQPSTRDSCIRVLKSCRSYLFQPHNEQKCVRKLTIWMIDNYVLFLERGLNEVPDADNFADVAAAEQQQPHPQQKSQQTQQAHQSQPQPQQAEVVCPKARVSKVRCKDRSQCSICIIRDIDQQKGSKIEQLDNTVFKSESESGSFNALTSTVIMCKKNYTNDNSDQSRQISREITSMRYHLEKDRCHVGDDLGADDLSTRDMELCRQVDHTDKKVLCTLSEERLMTEMFSGDLEDSIQLSRSEGDIPRVCLRKIPRVDYRKFY